MRWRVYFITKNHAGTEFHHAWFTDADSIITAVANIQTEVAYIGVDEIAVVAVHKAGWRG